MTGANAKIKRIYVGDKQVRPSGWKPGSNTVAYYPLTSNTTGNDKSGNNYNLSNTNVSFGINAGVDCANFPGGSSNNLLQTTGFYKLSDGDYTINLRAYRPSTSIHGDGYLFWEGPAGADKGRISGICFTSTRLRFFFWFDDLDASVNPSAQWTNIVCQFKKSNNQQLIYVNGVFNISRTTTYTHNISTPNLAFGGRYNNSYTDNIWGGYLSNVIIENKLWTATEISNYYNSTKYNYGL